ncbi:hypothetical protein [Massilia polaris]|nr:hypothetical protein [Massilia polaris]
MFLIAVAVAGCGKTSAPVSPLDAAARRTCMDTIESRAVNSKSVDYTNEDPAVAKDAKGQLDVSIAFSAKNEMGMASRMVAKCIVSPDGKTLVDIAVKETR